MIIHIYSDGSKGYEYEIGDKIHCNEAIHGGWFTDCVKSAPYCVVAKIEKTTYWSIRNLEVKHSNDWGFVSVKPWFCTPHAETLAKARTVHEPH